MRRKLAVVRWGEKEHLLCLAPTGDTVIASRDASAGVQADCRRTPPMTAGQQ
jgi:hypothetical protein